MHEYELTYATAHYLKCGRAEMAGMLYRYQYSYSRNQSAILQEAK